MPNFSPMGSSSWLVFKLLLSLSTTLLLSFLDLLPLVAHEMCVLDSALLCFYNVLLLCICLALIVYPVSRFQESLESFICLSYKNRIHSTTSRNPPPKQNQVLKSKMVITFSLVYLFKHSF